MYYSYPKIKQLEKTGASLCPKCPAMTANSRPAKTVELTAAALADLFAAGKLAADTAYAVNDAATLVLSDMEIDGNGACVIAPAGVVLRAITSCKNLTVLAGGVTLCETKGATLENLQISGADTALTVEDTACEIDLVDLRLSAKCAAASGSACRRPRRELSSTCCPPTLQTMPTPFCVLKSSATGRSVFPQRAIIARAIGWREGCSAAAQSSKIACSESSPAEKIASTRNSARVRVPVLSSTTVSTL